MTRREGLSSAEYARLDGVALGELVRDGAVTPAEVAASALEAARRIDPRLGAVVELFEDAAPAAGALPASAPARGRSSPLYGVPFLLKDIGATAAGRKQECGSRLLAGRVADHDAYLTARLKRAGLVAVGRSAAPEFALSLSTESVLYGTTRNPWNPSRIAGGSSGGAAAAVAAGIVPVAHATDAAGSIRIPASACGLVGLKPSRGRVTQGPDAGEALMGMNSQLCVSRTVRDTAAFLDAVTGPAPGDPVALPAPAEPFARQVASAAADGAEPLRIAWTATGWGGNATDAEVAAATSEVAARLAGMGHELVEATPIFDYDAFVDAACVGWALGFDLLLEMYAAQLGRPLDGSTLEHVTLLLYEKARRLTAHDVTIADTTFNRIRRGVGAFFEDFDVLLTPTLLRPPEPLGRYAQTVAHPDFASFFRLCDEAGAMLPLFNMTGQPAISLPLAWSADGLPLGMQLVARPGEDALLLRLAAVLEEAMPWRDRLPPIHAARA